MRGSNSAHPRLPLNLYLPISISCLYLLSLSPYLYLLSLSSYAAAAVLLPSYDTTVTAWHSTALAFVRSGAERSGVVYVDEGDGGDNVHKGDNVHR